MSRSYCRSNEIWRNYGFTQRRKLNRFTPYDWMLAWEFVKTPRFLSKHVTSEQKVLSSWNKIPMEDKMIKYCNLTQFWCKGMKLGVLLWNDFIFLFFYFFFVFCIPILSVYAYTSNEVKLFFSDRDIVTDMEYINSLFDQNNNFFSYFIVCRPYHVLPYYCSRKTPLK